MTGIEERLRDAFAEGAHAVRPETVRPLSLPQRRRRRTWAVPAMSAAAVAIAVALVVAITGRPQPNAAAGGGGPAFIVAVTGFGEFPKGASRVEVRDSRTEKPYDTRAASQGLTFQYVTAAQDNRTFFVMEVPIRQTACDTIRVYRMRVADNGRIASFTPLGTRIQGGTMRREALPGGLAVSPDGRRLAYAVLPCGTPADRVFYKIGVVDLRTGAQREWTDPEESVISSLSWTADDRKVAFLRREPTHQPDDGNHRLTRNGVVRLLNTDAKDSSLLSSAVLVRRSARLTDIWAAAISGDGDTISVVGEYAPLDGTYTICEIAVADGRVLRTLYHESEDGQPVPPLPHWSGRVSLRTDPSGRHLLFHDGGNTNDFGFGRIDDGRFRTLQHTDAHDEAFEPDDLVW
ncbi:beta-propeller domain-containing protein [Actinoallomurus rhizosphaericola]|uniref:hypothetical protein n=1 Tax=Actinoallomurus rhizosphaericola TaxID=2952536 RepID=UPI00209314A0|nr:hypothetical protein [Actinoallomurus rhizosphaericola]MCO5996841.1 hypothetical protein [Actinoallomurus rhizosphaericola]